MPHPFEQLPEETSKAFTAFVEYLRLGPQRSTEQVAKNLKKSPGTLRDWQVRFAWVTRARAYDAHLIEVERATLEIATKSKAIEQLRRREEIKEREWEVAKLALGKLEDWLRNGNVQIKNIRDAAYMLDIASKVGRLSLGLATEHQEVTGEGGGPIQVNVMPALKKVYGQVEDAPTVKDSLIVDAIEVNDGNGSRVDEIPAGCESGGLPGGSD